jgi:transketolase
MIDLKRKANEIRNKVLDMCLHSGGHIASSFSCLDILVSLYHGKILQVNPRNAEWEDRDRFILSKGHGETVFYAVLADMGFFPEEWIQSSYRRGNCFLGGHPDKYIPGVEVTTGALGHGLGIACGMSLAAKMDNKKHFHFVLMGDGECTEGSVWEAAMFASKQSLHNLIAIVDRNGIGSIDFTENYACLEPFAEKWKAFGWEVRVCNGHNFSDLDNTFRSARTATSQKPQLIIAKTVKGKGISFIENNPVWHARSISGDDEIQQAKQDLMWGENGL